MLFNIPKKRAEFTSHAERDGVLRLNGTLKIGDGYCYLHDYQPYRINGIKNPAFDASSGRILDLKDGKPDAVRYYHAQVLPLIFRGVALFVVPSHDPQKLTSGIRRVAKDLAGTGNFVDQNHNLARLKKIDKLANGGSREIQVHLDSMALRMPHLVPERVLVLDDVVTSGASLKAAQQLLLECGAKWVYCLAMAKTV